MNTCPLVNLCKCDGAYICLFCIALTVIFIAVVGGLIGYLIGKKKRDKSAPKRP